jgi:aminoglycoside phosphotransferase (APT) family kinase protein
VNQPPDAILEWAASAVSPGAAVVGIDQLRTSSGPWMLRVEHNGIVTEAVLKCGPAVDWRDAYACEAAALRVAAEHDVPVPALLGSQLDGSGDEPVALLMERLPGATKIPPAATGERHRALGRAAAAIHRIPLQPSSELPLRERHTAWVDFALWRRWGGRYRSAPESERDAVVGAFVEDNPNWSVQQALEELMSPHAESTPLLDEADGCLRAAPAPEGELVFVHGDLWQGNTLWDGDRCTGIIDWETAGAGHPGVDLGCLRWDAEMLFGAGAADDVLTGWEEAGGRPADAVAYWDIVAVLNYPTDMKYIVSSLTEQGRPDLDADTLNARRDAFLASAMSALSEQ